MRAPGLPALRTNPKNIRTQLDQRPDGRFSVFHAQDPDAGGSRSVLLGRSSEQGQSWDTSLVYSPGDAPAIASGPDGQLVAWSDMRLGDAGRA